MNHDPTSTRKLLEDAGLDINEMTEALICQAGRLLGRSPFITYDKEKVIPVAQIMATLLVAQLVNRRGAK